jgi:hypothetical protein
MFYTRKFLGQMSLATISISMKVLSEMSVTKMVALTLVCTSVANLDMDKRRGKYGPHKRKKEDILCFN